MRNNLCGDRILLNSSLGSVEVAFKRFAGALPEEVTLRAYLHRSALGLPHNSYRHPAPLHPFLSFSHK
eukprot:3014627-Amphidinium_carterae.1